MSGWGRIRQPCDVNPASALDGEPERQGRVVANNSHSVILRFTGRHESPWFAVLPLGW